MREKEVRFQVSGARSAAKDLGRDFDRSEADATDGDAIALLEFVVQSGSSYSKAAVAVLVSDASNASDFFDDAGKHGLYCSAGVPLASSGASGSGPAFNRSRC